jgi:hypothetical protein
MSPRSVVFSGAVAGVLVVASAGPSRAQATCPFSTTGSLAPPDLTTSPRLFRDDPATTCAASQVCLLSPGGPFQIDLYTFQTPPGPMAACTTVTLTSPCGGVPTFLHSGAFRGVVTLPVACNANFLGDLGDSPLANVPKSFSFNVLPATLFTVVVNEITGGAGCPSYTLDVTGCENTPVGVLDFSVHR